MTTSINGIPAASADPHTNNATKRKRESNTPVTQTNGINPSALPSGSKTQESIRNIWQVLRSREPSPFLDNLKNSPSSSTSQERSAKRQKLSSTPNPGTIDSKINGSDYQSMDQFVNDVESAISDALSTTSNSNQENGNDQSQPESSSLDKHRKVADIKAFRKYFRNLIERERPRTEQTPSTNGVIKDEESDNMSTSNDVLNSTVKVEDEQDSEGRTVLTIFGIAQGHKQLFSSFQQPTSGLDVESPEVLVPVREKSLPTGIKTTRIHPVTAEASGSEKKRTFGEVFGPPAHLPQLTAPKPSKTSATRNNSITWGPTEGQQSRNRQAGYTNEKLPTGHWLGYGGVAISQEPTSPEAKRKMRDRALSAGESAMTPSLGVMAAQAQAKEEALFRKVFSSFAPCKDNSTALVSEEVKNQIWWQRTGQAAFESMCAIDPALEEAVVEDESLVNVSGDQNEEDIYRQAVEAYDERFDPSEDRQSEGQDKDTTELLAEISNMLETLHSYQRIRHSTLTTGSLTTLSQNAPLPSMAGNPSTPSEAEVETYNLLRSQLALMVAMLPPFAVAKLNGEQLDDLNISHNIVMETPSVQGVMEEDQATRIARAAALQAAVAGPANRPAVPGTPQQPGYPGASRTAQMAQQRPQLPQYGSQTAPRPQSSFQQRQPLSSWQTPITQPRPSYNQQPSYNQAYSQTPRGNPNPTMRPPPQYYQHQRTASGTGSQPNGIHPSPSPALYSQQQHGQIHRPPSYGGPLSGPAQGSPQKSMAYNTPQPYGGQGQPPQSPQQYQNYQGQDSTPSGRPNTAGSYQNQPFQTPQAQQPTPSMMAASPPRLVKSPSYVSATSPPTRPLSAQQTSMQAMDARPGSSGSAMSGVSPAPVANMGRGNAAVSSAGSTNGTPQPAAQQNAGIVTTNGDTEAS